MGMSCYVLACDPVDAWLLHGLRKKQELAVRAWVDAIDWQRTPIGEGHGLAGGLLVHVDHTWLVPTKPCQRAE